MAKTNLYHDNLVNIVEPLFRNESKEMNELRAKSKPFLTLCSSRDHYAPANVSIYQLQALVQLLINLDSNVKNSYQKTLHLVPDRIAARKLKISRSTLNFIIKRLSKDFAEYITFKKCNGVWNYKLNAPLLEDEFFMKLASTRFKNDFKVAYELARTGNGSMYFDKLSDDVFNRKFNSSLLAFQFAYYEICSPHYNTAETNQRLAETDDEDKRTDITYLELPMHIATIALNCSEYDIIKAMSNLTSHTDYISKHNKVYINLESGVHDYKNENYRKAVPKASTNSAYFIQDSTRCIGESHNTVSSYSYILFNEKFANSRMRRDVLRKLPMYRILVKDAVKIYNHLKEKAKSHFKDDFDEVKFQKSIYTQEAYKAFMTADAKFLQEIEDKEDFLKECKSRRLFGCSTRDIVYDLSTEFIKEIDLFDILSSSTGKIISRNELEEESENLYKLPKNQKTFMSSDIMMSDTKKSIIIKESAKDLMVETKAGVHLTTIKTHSQEMLEESSKCKMPKIPAFNKLKDNVEHLCKVEKLKYAQNLINAQIKKVLKFFEVREMLNDSDLVRYTNYVTQCQNLLASL